MLREYSHAKCKSLVQFHTTVAKIQHFFWGIVFYWRTLYGYCVVIGRKSKSAYYLHSSRWHFQTRWTIEMSLGAFKAAMVYIIIYLI